MTTDLERRWNLAASRAGFAGSEYVDEPEAVFARVADLQRRYQEARLELAKLRNAGWE